MNLKTQGWHRIYHSLLSIICWLIKLEFTWLCHLQLVYAKFAIFRMLLMKILTSWWWYTVSTAEQSPTFQRCTVPSPWVQESNLGQFSRCNISEDLNLQMLPALPASNKPAEPFVLPLHSPELIWQEVLFGQKINHNCRQIVAILKLFIWNMRNDKYCYVQNKIIIQIKQFLKPAKNLQL